MVKNEVFSSGPHLVGNRLSFRQFGCQPFMMLTIFHDVEMDRELIRERVKGMN